MAQVTFVATASSSSLVGTSMTINKPTGTVDGDVMIAYFSAGVAGNTMTTLAGWTALYQKNTSDQAHVFYKIASSEGASYTWTHWNANNSAIVGTISTFRSSHQTLPVAEYSELYDSTSNTTATGTALTPTTNPDALLCMFVAGYAVTSFSGYAVANNDPGWTEAYDVSADGSTSDCTQAMAYGVYLANTTTGVPTATIANATTGHVTLISIRPTGQTISPPVLTAASSNPQVVNGIGIAVALLSAATSIATVTFAQGISAILNLPKSISTWLNLDKS